ncbi:MAG: aminotransferase class V-fold PLP-dependent enzyme [Candidatus Omnitrophica bacterium]|nr:aminotransferase class V-fold PLP-dependent enzyme [Candidatus Omnitrophota bacterium]
MSNRRIYLDNNATTPLHPEVKTALKEGMDAYGNPSSMHSFGREARTLVEKARENVASFIGASAEELVFVGSGSEANNTVLSIFTCTLEKKCTCDRCGGSGVITTTIEHPCVLETSKCLIDKGVNVRYIGVDRYGKVDPEKLAEMIDGETGLVSIMMANNEIGTILDIKELAGVVHEKGALFHTDAVQAVGKVPVDVNELGVDFLTISAHKMYGPKGVGALYIRKGIPFCPLIRGGHQEKGRRAGTENTLGIIGLSKAVDMRRKEMKDEEERLLGFKTRLKEGLEAAVPDISFNGHPEDSLPGTVNVSFEGAEGEAILLYLDMEGIAVSTGSACASGSLDPSHVLLATGLSAEYAHGSVRISMGRETTGKDIDRVLAVFPEVINRIRNMSSAYKKGEK